MAYRILLRRDSSENWLTSNTVLMAGEPGYVTNTGELKIGDGVTAWDSLAVYAGITGATGSMGITGPTGAGGTGANTFYGSQTIAGTTGTLILANYSLYDFPNDVYAATGGIPLGGLYHDTGAVRIRLT
jgi:hypothetical protein